MAVRKTGVPKPGREVQNPDLPVHPPASGTMKVDFLFNKDGGAWLLHDKPLPDILKWIEYDADDESVTLVAQNGKVQNLGLKIPADMGAYLHIAMTVTALRMEGDKIADFAVVPLITRDTAVN